MANIALNENQWIQISNTPVTREMLMMALPEVKSISIRANVNMDTTQVAIKNINFETATNLSPSLAVHPLSTVEKCACPEGYTGSLFYSY